jgi:hypothetical protein
MRTLALVLLYPVRLLAEATATRPAETCAARISFHRSEQPEQGVAA